MKMLYLLRHAKSSWDNSELSDHDRPLNKRGKEDAPKMGKWLSKKLSPPQLILCSDSARTKATIEAVMKPWQLDEQALQYESDLYHASPETLWELTQNCDDAVECLMLVGHNPGFTDFANIVSPAFQIGNLPTCGFAAFSFDVQHWKKAKANEASFEAYQFPKNL